MEVELTQELQIEAGSKYCIVCAITGPQSNYGNDGKVSLSLSPSLCPHRLSIITITAITIIITTSTLLCHCHHCYQVSTESESASTTVKWHQTDCSDNGTGVGSGQIGGIKFYIAGKSAATPTVVAPSLPPALPNTFAVGSDWALVEVPWPCMCDTARMQS